MVMREDNRISNKALLLAVIAAIISVATALLGFLPRGEPIKAQDTPTPVIAVSSPTPRSLPTPKPSHTQKPKQISMPESTLDYPRRHKPTLLSPDDNALFSYFYSSGKLVLRWRRTAASDADKYKVEVEYGNLSHRPPWLLREIETPWDYCTVEFAGTQAVDFSGRWRVTPVFTDGRLGVPTEWRTFRFVQ